MSRAFPSVVLALASRFTRARWIRTMAITIGVVTALLTAAGLTIESLDLTPSQVSEQNLGSYESKLDLTGTVELKPGQSVEDLLPENFHKGASDIAIELYSVDIRLPQADDAFAPFIEAKWSSHFFETRYRLTAGRWGERPGEVVLTNPPAAISLERNLDVLSGNTDWKVVGFADDRYGKYPSLLASQGSWSMLRPAALSDFRALAASPRVYGGPGADARAIEIATHLSTAGASGDDTESTNSVTDVASLLQTRDSISDLARSTSNARAPLAYLIPSVIFPILAVLLSLALYEHRFRNRFEILDGLGIGRFSTGAALWTAVTVWIGVGCAVGGVIGTLLAEAVRPLVAPRHPLPLSPLGAVWVTPLKTLIVASVTAAILLTGQARRSTAESSPHSPRKLRLPSELWWSTVFILLGAIAVQSLQLVSLQRWMFLTATIALLVALSGGKIVRQIATKLIAPHPTASSLALRKLAARGGRGSAVVSIVAVGAGLACGLLILLSTVTNSSVAGSVPDVRPDQVAVNGVGGILEPATPAVKRFAARALGDSAVPIQMRYLGSIDSPVWARNDGFGFVGVFKNVDQLQEFFPNPLPEEAVRNLESGGAIHWDDQTRQRSLRASDSEPGVIVESRRVDAPAVGWNESIVVATLEDSARRRGLPLATGATIYDNVSRRAASRLRERARAEGLDIDQIVVFEDPKAPLPPLLLIFSAATLLMLLFSTTFVAVQTQSDSLRESISMARAIGLPRNWCRRVVATELIASIAVATILAIVVGVAPAFIASRGISDLTITIPVGEVLGLFAAVYLTSLSAFVIGTRELSPRS